MKPIELSIPDRVHRVGIYLLALTWVGVVTGLTIHFAPMFSQSTPVAIGATEIPTTAYSLRVENQQLRQRISLLNSQLDSVMSAQNLPAPPSMQPQQISKPDGHSSSPESSHVSNEKRK